MKVGRSAIKVYRSFSSLSLPLKIKKKRSKIEDAIRNILLYAAVENTSIHQVSHSVAGIDGDTVMYHLSKLTVSDVVTMNTHLKRIFNELRRKRKLPRKLVLAVDSTDYKFYGKQRGAGVIHYKSNYVFRYIMVSIVAHKTMYPLVLLPVSQFSDMVELVERLIEAVKRLQIRVKVMYFDRGFYSVRMVRLLKRYRLPFVIGADKSRGVKRILTTLTEGDSMLHEYAYILKSQDGMEQVTLYVRWNRKKGQWFTVVGWGVTPQDVRGYVHRWGIETEFRMIKNPRIRTTTVRYAVRYLFVMISAIVCAIYAALRLGEIVEYIDACIILEDKEGVTLYKVRNAIRTVLERGESIVL